MSNVILVSTDSTEEELRSFAQWLQDEPDIRSNATITLESAEPREGAMGSAFEYVKLVIDTNFQILNFGLAYAAWRATRPVPHPVIIERGGVKVVLDDGDPATIARIIRALDE